MEEIIRQYLAFFSKEGSRRGHPLEKRNGYMEELATLTGLLISSPEKTYKDLSSNIDDAFNFWKSGCEICEAKKLGFMYLMHRHRDNIKAGIAWRNYMKIQCLSIERWHPGEIGRIYFKEVLHAMDLWGNDAYVLSPSGDIIQLEKNLKKTILIENPELFGYSREYFEKIYKRYNETYLMECGAWDDIKNKLLDQGWVYAQYNPSKNLLTLYLQQFDIEVKKKIIVFTNYLISENIYSEKYTSVRLMHGGEEVVKTRRLSNNTI